MVIRPVRRSAVGGSAMALCVLVGVYAMRYNVVLGGQMQSKVSQSIIGMSVPLTGFDSVQTVIGVFAVAFLVFLFFSWLLPWRQAAAQAAEADAVATEEPGTPISTVRTRGDEKLTAGSGVRPREEGVTP